MEFYKNPTRFSEHSSIDFKVISLQEQRIVSIQKQVKIALEDYIGLPLLVLERVSNKDGFSRIISYHPATNTIHESYFNKGKKLGDSLKRNGIIWIEQGPAIMEKARTMVEKACIPTH